MSKDKESPKTDPLEVLFRGTGGAYGSTAVMQTQQIHSVRTTLLDNPNDTDVARTAEHLEQLYTSKGPFVLGDYDADMEMYHAKSSGGGGSYMNSNQHETEEERLRHQRSEDAIHFHNIMCDHAHDIADAYNHVLNDYQTHNWDRYKSNESSIAANNIDEAKAKQVASNVQGDLAVEGVHVVLLSDIDPNFKQKGMMDSIVYKDADGSFHVFGVDGQQKIKLDADQTRAAQNLVSKGAITGDNTSYQPEILKIQGKLAEARMIGLSTAGLTQEQQHIQTQNAEIEKMKKEFADAASKNPPDTQTMQDIDARFQQMATASGRTVESLKGVTERSTTAAGATMTAAPAPAPSAIQDLVTQSTPAISSMLVDQAKLTGSITDADLRAAAKLYNIPESSLQSLKTALEADPAVKKLMEPKPTDIAAYTPQVFTGRAPEPITIAANSPDVLILKDGLRPLSAAKDAFGEPDSGLPKTFAAASEKPAPVAPGNDLDRDYAAKPTGPTVSINA